MNTANYNSKTNKSFVIKNSTRWFTIFKFLNKDQ